MTRAESILICEGFHDRAFLSGWLRAHGCTEWKTASYPPHAKRVSGKGQYAFRAPSERWLRVVPVQGSDWKAVANLEVASSKTRPVDRIVVIVDDDSHAQASTARHDSFVHWASSIGATAAQGSPDFELADGLVPTRLSLVVWRATEAHADTLPPQQTLERLACAAIVRSHPERGAYVRDWLANRPSAPVKEKLHKSHAASHMAGWFSERGYEGFFGALWEDPVTRPALESLLDEIGAASVLNQLL